MCRRVGSGRGLRWGLGVRLALALLGGCQQAAAGACERDEDCAARSICLDGVCAKVCIDRFDCEATELCSGGICVGCGRSCPGPGDGPDGPSNGDAGVGDGRLCGDGRCNDDGALADADGGELGGDTRQGDPGGDVSGGGDPAGDGAAGDPSCDAGDAAALGCGIPDRCGQVVGDRCDPGCPDHCADPACHAHGGSCGGLDECGHGPFGGRCDPGCPDHCADDACHAHGGSCGGADGCGHVFGSPADCGCPAGTCPPACGNGVCEAGESCFNCNSLSGGDCDPPDGCAPDGTEVQAEYCDGGGSWSLDPRPCCSCDTSCSMDFGGSGVACIGSNCTPGREIVHSCAP